MGAESCEECFVPLMSDRRLKASLCVACQPTLAKMLVQGYKVVQDGPLFLIEDASQSKQFRIEKTNGMFKYVGDIKEVSAPAPEKPEEVKKEAAAKPEAPQEKAQPVSAAPIQPAQPVTETPQVQSQTPQPVAI